MENKLKFTGIVTVKTAVFKGEKGDIRYESQSLGVEIDPSIKYGRKLCVDAFDWNLDNLKFDKVKLLENVKVGDLVEVQYETDFRAYTGRAGSAISGSNNLWSIKVLNSKESAANMLQNTPTSEPANVVASDGDDSLPF